VFERRIFHSDFNVPGRGPLSRWNTWVDKVVQNYRIWGDQISVHDVGEFLEADGLSAENLVEKNVIGIDKKIWKEKKLTGLSFSSARITRRSTLSCSP